MTNHAALAQAYLFAEGGPLSFKKLGQLMNVDQSQVFAALEDLSRSLATSGLCIVRTDTEVTLATASGPSESLRAQYEKELGREVGEAGLEVLAIVLYRGPSTRASIDYIRGVNTSSTIRTLLARGLLERAGNPHDSREYLYRPTVELLAHIGAQQVQNVPEYGTISSELKAFEEQGSPFNISPPEATLESISETTIENNNESYARGNDTNTTDTGGSSAAFEPGSDTN